MKTLCADDIFKVKDFQIEKVVVPEWGGEVYIRTFSARHREQFDALITDENYEVITDNIRARVLAFSMCDASGKLMFTAEQAEVLGEKSDEAIGRIYDRAAALNKLRKKDREAEKKESGTPQPAG